MQFVGYVPHNLRAIISGNDRMIHLINWLDTNFIEVVVEVPEVIVLEDKDKKRKGRK
jgi:hypothetical protein